MHLSTLQQDNRTPLPPNHHKHTPTQNTNTGGTFALYALICRAAGFTPFGPAQPEELQLSGGGRLGGALPPWMKRGKWWSLTNTAGEPLRRAYARSTTAQVSETWRDAAAPLCLSCH
jgi:hypothetical protein